MIDCKSCTKCKVTKPLSDFLPNKIYKDGLTYYCRSCINLTNKERYHSSPSMRERVKRSTATYYSKNIERVRLYNQKLAYNYKLLVVQHYSNGSNSCQCCGEKHLEFLSLDHINGNGNAHRRTIKMKSGWTFYKWVINNNYPTGYRILCHNCNQAHGNFGNCPHKGDTIYSRFKLPLEHTV